MAKVLYLDQNAWVTLAQGAWDKTAFPKEHAALATVVEAVKEHHVIVPLGFTNIYETSKINRADRRANMARTQALISDGQVLRGRRRILEETLLSYLAGRFSRSRAPLPDRWFLSDLWFEAAADYSADLLGFEISPKALEFVRTHPAQTLFHYLTFNDENVRLEAVRRYTASSAELISGIEERRAIVANEPLPMRRRAYGARLVIDELNFIMATGRRLGLNWHSVSDLGSSLVRSLTVDVPVFHVERELVVRLEDQSRAVSENDLRDMDSFTTALPLVDIVIAEKQFVNLAQQAGLGKKYETALFTSIFDLRDAI